MNNPTQFAQGRALDVICLGRLAVDLYAQQIGSPLEDATSFAKYLGGSSANIAFGTARLGLKSGHAVESGRRPHGPFLTDTLSRKAATSATSASTANASRPW
jgi:5-dehydro-2-deoxygluconokinase